jgi:hypothetical protein
MVRRVKVVWIEGAEVHSVVATPAGEENGFLKFQLPNGGFLLHLQRSSVIKIEELSQ